MFVTSAMRLGSPLSTKGTLNEGWMNEWMNKQMNASMDSLPRSTPSRDNSGIQVLWQQCDNLKSECASYPQPPRILNHEPENPNPEKMQHAPTPISKLDHKSLWEKLSLSPLSPWFLAQSCIQNSCLMEGKTIGWLRGSSKWAFWNQKFSSRLNH